MRVLSISIATILMLMSVDQSAARGGRYFFGYIPLQKSEFDAFPRTPRYRSFLPEAVDLSSRFPIPGEQGKLNSCTAWAVGYAARSYYAVTVEGRGQNRPEDIPSPRFIYQTIRDPDDCQSGSTFPAAFALLREGSLSLAESPYSISCERPSRKQHGRAVDFRIEDWVAVDPDVIDDVKGQIASGNPVMFGMKVGEEFTEHEGSVAYSENEQRFSLHAMTVVGYDDRRQAVKIINSWGTAWGNGGFGWIAYDKFRAETLEAYVIHVSKPPEPRVEVEPPKPLPEPAVKPEPTVTPGPSPAIVTPKPEVGPEFVVEPTTKPDCSSLVQREEGGRVLISGFVGSDGALQRLAKLYPEPQYALDVELRPWPQCEVLMTLNNRIYADDAPHVAIQGDDTELKSGDALTIGVETPKQPSYIYISYVQANGSVVHLYQPSGPVQSPTKSATQLLFGDGQEGRARFTVVPPYGTEMVVVLASASPLFDGQLPDNQIEREYLSALRKALIYKADPSLPDRKVTAAFLGIETREE